ncbi:hypothetical protein PGT21_025079 [Puccinia graminis f. sp. tritici]|uniref:Uncharacterized protein n=1 Tax=Puccinia graminis f. sp. tritici TaxID=56615 RepID=A0A5B0NB13_PUCGR|nr:hypothetical protein PGT21_025079 [Puccinia graminis f. sp. tritici]KAA1113786.1 hypothetical protein PGTUg99_020460 [Puccinia graminis f. sp. tritici]
MDRPKLFPGVLLKSDANHAPFAQPSPPPRRNPNHRSASNQSQRPGRPSLNQQNSSSVQQLISPPIVRPSPPLPQWLQQQQLKKRKLRQPQPEEAVPPKPTTAVSRKPRSRIPFQWRLPSSSASSTGGSTSNQASLPNLSSEQVLPDDTSQPYPGPNNPSQKVPHKKSSIFHSLVRSHSISSNVSASSTSAASYLTANRPQAAPRSLSNHSDSIASRSSSSGSAILKSICSDESIETHPRPTCTTSSPPAGSHPSSSSSSLHPSLNCPTDSEFESLSDDHEEVLSSHSHLTSLAAARATVRTPSPGPFISNSSTHSLGSVSQSRVSEASCPPISSPPPQCPLPPSPSDTTHDTLSQPFSELPFACPSPNMPSHRVTNRQGRPKLAQAPPLPRSRTPSLVIRPKFASSQHNLDLTTHSTSSKCSSDAHHPHNNAPDHVDLQDRPISGPPKSEMMRGLGWGRAPIDPPRLISPSPSLVQNPSLSDLSINRPLQDAIIADYLLAPHSSNEPPQPSQLSSPQETPLLNRTKTFKDRFTLASTAPLRLSKRQHVRHQSTASGTGRSIASSLFGALSPTSNRHTVMDPEDEKRKVEFKRMISYPVLNHCTSGDHDASNADDLKNYQSEPELDGYNVSIEAAMRSLEGIKPPEIDSITKPAGSTKFTSNELEDRPISWTFEDKPDLSDFEASREFSFTGAKSDAWTQKLKRRVSVNRLMIKSRNNQASSPSPVSRSKNSPDSGFRQYKVAQKQLRNKASARLRPLIRKVSSVSGRQRAWTAESESRVAFEAHKLDRTGEENEEEELLALGRTPTRRANPERLINFKAESRLRAIRSSISRGHTPRSASSPTVSLITPQQNKPFLRSSQSIREKRKIFERPINPSSDSIPRYSCSAHSSLAVSIASSSHSTSMGTLSSTSAVDRRSSVPSERRHSKRKPTPAEIKLRNETQSVKALVDKFETQHHHNSLGRSIESDSQRKRARDSSKAGRSSGTGVIRTSLLSLWSGDRSSLGSKRVVSRRVSRQLVIDQRRKASGRSSTESAFRGEAARPIRKLKKKPKKIFRDNGSSSSSFGCAFDEEDEYTFELEDPHVDMSLPVELPGASDSNNRHLSMLLPKSSIQQKRSTWSVNNSSPRRSVENKLKPPVDQNLKNLKSHSTSSNASRSDCNSSEIDNQDRLDSAPKSLNEQPSLDCVDSNQDRAYSPLSSDQAHKAPTVLEPQTVWMGDGSQRKILVAGGCLHVAKKIPFPSFEDDVEFTQNLNLEQRPLSTEPLSSEVVSQPSAQSTQTNQISTFLRTRQFEDELEEDEGEEVSPRNGSTRMTSLGQNQERGMLSPVGMASLQDSPTLGRGRRSWQRPMLHGCSKSSRSSSAGRPHSTPGLLLVAASDVGEKDETCSSYSGASSSHEIQQMYLGVQRCEGLGNKMFGSSISIPQHLQDSPVGRRATSAIISSSTARLLPISPTGSCPSPSTSHLPSSESPQTTIPAHGIPDRLQPSSPPALTSTRSSMLKCERLIQFKEDNLTEMTDPLDLGNETPQDHDPKHDQRRLSSAPTKNPNTPTIDLEDLVVDEVTAKALRHEIARLERVRIKWMKLCLEVEDVLRKSRERWPDQDRSIKVLKDFVSPTTRSSIDTFLEKSRRLYKQTSGKAFTASQADHFGSANKVHDLTPPPKHPFGRQSIVSVSAGNLPPRTRGRDSVNSRESFMTPSKPKGANRSQAQKGFPILITLPVPSAFVSPERFRGCVKVPRSEQGPRVLKISNRSCRSGPRQPTLSNRLGSPSIKLMNARDQRGRMMSGTSSGNVSISSNGKIILGERSVNQLPDRSAQAAGEKKSASFSPKPSGNNTPMSGRTVGSLGRASRPSTGKWGSENEGPLWMSASVRETRKPWRRSVLNQEILPREPRLSLADSATGSIGSAPEEVGVLVAAGEQPHEFSSGFHVSGSLRLKHRRRLNQIRNE